ncbi:hypothetical protein DL769_005664 [Monosporascus sp. CRB-8-3]|nr:hypothetical protein DL769_005664 [Monosporascus sp. CRB-8-3]
MAPWRALRARGTDASFRLIPPRSAVKQGSLLVREAKRAAREAAVRHSDAAAAEFTRLCGIMLPTDGGQPGD